MGYRSRGVLGINKKTLIASQVVANNLPKLLSDMAKLEDEGLLDTVVYFTYDGFKMYASYPDVSEFYNWLNYLDKLHEDAASDDFNEYTPECYGYLEIGEEGEIVANRGNTDHFDIYTNTTIEFPLGDV